LDCRLKLQLLVPSRDEQVKETNHLMCPRRLNLLEEQQ